MPSISPIINKNMFRITTKISNTARSTQVAFHEKLMKLPAGEYNIYVTDEKPDKTKEQLGFYYGCIVPEVSRHLGCPAGQIHKSFCLAFNPIEVIDLKSGMKILAPGSVGDLNQAQMSEFLENCIDWAWQELKMSIVADKDWKAKLIGRERWKEKEFPDEFIIENALENDL